MKIRIIHPVVVLTGASSGIGHATALALARRGARLVLVARGRRGLERVAAECEALGAQTLVLPTDVTDAHAVREVAESAIAHFGHIDVWINGVGVGVVGLFDKTPIEAHRQVIESNLIGHMNGAHVALGHFRERQRGTLINMISIGGWAPSPYASAYTASKFALRGWSEALRAEMSGFADVHVCAVYPTFVDTPGIAHGANYTRRQLAPPPPLLDPRQVATAIVALIDAPRAFVAIGSAAWPARIAHAIAPGLLGRATMAAMKRTFERADAAPITEGNLYTPSVGTGIDGGYRRPGRALALGAVSVVTAAALIAWALNSRSARRRSNR